MALNSILASHPMIPPLTTVFYFLGMLEYNLQTFYHFLPLYGMHYDSAIICLSKSFPYFRLNSHATKVCRF